MLPTPSGPARALITCVGFANGGADANVVFDDGWPAAVALLLAQALKRCGDHGDPPAALLKHLSHYGSNNTSNPRASYHYQIRLASKPPRRLHVACWRRYPGAWGWQRRCGPMPLERFLQRFLEADGRAFSGADANVRGASS